MANGGTLIVNVRLDVPDETAAACAAVLTMYLQNHEDVTIVQTDDGEDRKLELHGGPFEERKMVSDGNGGYNLE